MRHGNHFKKLGRDSEHRRALLRNMATSLIVDQRMKTTVAKAKALKPIADQMVTWGKEGTWSARRLAHAFAQTNVAVDKLFNELGPRYKDRNGGYTRIILAGRRYGDNAPMAYIEYIDNDLPTQISKKQELQNSGRWEGLFGKEALEARAAEKEAARKSKRDAAISALEEKAAALKHELENVY
eukprot:TRINITY_DN22810_c0_g1_i1.p1 TRINITY_DN22810_c0_g1~~TRINITY_DN22810_c0_g1_i1.p1  ORF type:complete len:183 (+),score=10.30 TRINITY_DN22810_c0_g1_i1:75-623(+)